MLLTISTTHRPATDLGFLLHKNPGRLHIFESSFGKAYVFYPVSTDERCTVALMLDIDPVGLVRGRRSAGEALEQYVNDRPYVASSFLSVALGKAFRTAMTGRSKERPDLTEQLLPLETRIPVLPCRGGEDLLRALFEPLGYHVEATQHALDTESPEWGASRYFTVILRQDIRLRDLLRHLYVLLPVLDDEKHYWVGDDEIEKLLRNANDWLPKHPARDRITERYLKHRRQLTRQALSRLLDEDLVDPDAQEDAHEREEEQIEERVGLAEQRIGGVLSALRSRGATSVADLGCGNGRLLQELLDEPKFAQVVGMDVSHHALEGARRRLRLERMPERKKARLTLIQGSLTYRDSRLKDFDALVLMEVIEHLEPDRISALETVLFENAQPESIIVTTPNVEYNVRFDKLPAGQFRHRDHRFEWTRQQFRDWAASVCARLPYSVSFLPVGPDDPEVGSPTQMAVFARVRTAAVPN